MSALQKEQQSAKSSEKTPAPPTPAQESTAAPKDAKGKVNAKAASNFAGGLAIAAAGTAPVAPAPLKQPAKATKKKSSVGEPAAMGAPPGTETGATANAAAPSSTGGGDGASVGAATAAYRATLAITSLAPSKLLKAYSGLGSAVSGAKKEDEDAAAGGIPVFHAVMPGDSAMQGGKPHSSANADKTVDDTVPGAEAKAPKKVTEKSKKSKRQKVDGKTKNEMKNVESALDFIKQLFGNVVGGIDTDSHVNTDAGDAPEIVFSGSSNPQRADQANTDANQTMNEGHEKFATAIDEGKQPADVHRLELDEVHEALRQPDLKIGEEQLAAGEQYYEKLVAQHTSKEIDNADKLLDADVQADMATANATMETTLQEQELERKKAVADASADIDRQNEEAHKAQEGLVADSKSKIATEQKATRKEQDAEVKKAKRSGDKERRQVEKDMEARETKDEKKVEQEYDKAEKKADAEKDKSEKKAETKKKEAEKKKSEQSWWDRVKSAVSDFVDACCSVIGDIFDALGKLVSGILNAVKDLACALIDAAIKWAKEALDALGGLLKGLVNGLLGDIFPGLAKRLNEAIDGAIDLAKKGVDTVGEKLKEGVTAAVDTVNAVVQKGLQVAKVGMQTAVRVAGCVATGDFEGAFLATFYGALEIAGVSRGDADKMLGDAKETLKLIVDSPGGFAGNLIKAGKEGFSNFGANFLSHFTGAVTGWLLGPVAAAGLKAPEKWDAQGIFGMVLGVLGVSGDSLKDMAAERIGKENMEALEKAYEYVMSFVQGGFAGLWDQLKGDLGNIWDLVLGMVTDYITKKVVQFGMEQLASLLAGPLGALWQALKTAWGIYCTVRDKINEIKEVLSAIFSSVSDIARGNTSKASKWVEDALAKVLGIAIDLGANLAGIGDIPDKIRGFVEGLQERVKTAIGKAMDWVLEKVKGLFAGKDEKKEEPKADEKAGEEPARTLPMEQLIAWQGGLITLRWSTEKGILLNADGPYKGLADNAIEAMKADVLKTPATEDRAVALKKLEAAKGFIFVNQSKAGSWVSEGQGSLEDLVARDRLIADCILMGLIPLDTMAEAAKAGEEPANPEAPNVIGQELKFTAAAESHRMWFAISEQGAELMVASKVRTAEEHFALFLRAIGKPDFGGDQEYAKALIIRGRKLAEIADVEAEAALAGIGDAAAMVGEEKTLVQIFSELFALTDGDVNKELVEYLENKMVGPDKEHLAPLVVQREAGMDMERAKQYSVEQLQSSGRRQWRELASSDQAFALDVAKTTKDSIATRKLKEIDNETWAAAKAKIPEFYKALVGSYRDNLSKGSDALYVAMQGPAGAWKGLGEEKPLNWPQMYRAHGAGSFFQFNISKDYKDEKVTELMAANPGLDEAKLRAGYKSTEGPVCAAFLNEHQGKDIPKSITSGSFRTGAWWTPDKRCVKASSGGAAALKDFGDLCEINALAPEWYAEGFVNLTIDTASAKFVRPTVWDGMMSPLWVQESEDLWSATGGGAIELVMQSSVDVSKLSSIQSHLLPADMVAALKKVAKDGPSVDEWTEDPSKIGASTDPNEQKVKDMQEGVADDTLKARAEADKQAAAVAAVVNYPGDPEKAVRDEGCNWVAVKHKYANPAGEQHMRKILRFRKGFVDSLLKEIMAGFPGVKAESDGSSDLTSDYDVSLGGPNEHEVVAAFNRAFRAKWGQEAGTVFDTNVYTYGNYMPDVVKNEDDTKTLTETMPITSAEGKAEDFKFQDIASLTKTRKYMSQDEWSSYVSGILNDITDRVTKAEAKRRFDDADAAYKAWQTQLHKQIVRINLTDVEADRLFDSGRQAVNAKVAEILASNPDAELEASNRLYEAKLRAAAVKSTERDEYARLVDDGSTGQDEIESLDKLTAEAKKLQGEALLYANEAYYSEGAVRHVVGNMQARHGIDLAAQQAMQSFNEQLGDTLKDIAHYASDFGQCAYRSSKYVDRLIAAAKEVTSKLSGVPMPSTAGSLGPMAKKLLPIRKGDAAPYNGMDDAQKAAEGASIATAHGVRSVGDLKSSVVKTGSELNSKARQQIQATPNSSSAA